MEYPTNKLSRLKKILKGCGSVLVAFSGGADSTLLLSVACEVLGGRVLAVTADSEVYPPGEAEEARSLARTFGCRHIVIKTEGLAGAAFRGNPPDRCYYCKRELYTLLLCMAREHGMNYVVDGVNAEDDAGDRPGIRAGSEMGVRSPLKEAGLNKHEIRAFSRKLSLSTAGKPASPCLASRFPYGTEITREGLEMVYKAELYLKALDLPQLRVRHHGNLARIEVPADRLDCIVERATEVASALKKIGYTYVALDLLGYRAGSMNEVL